MRTLITGVGGFIGTKLAEKLLQRGHKVTGTDNFLYKNQSSILPFLNHPNFTFYQIDCRNKTRMIYLLDETDVIFPLAALVGAKVCDQYPLDAEQTNTQSINDLVKYTSKNQRIIFPMTTSSYGTTTNLEYCDELTIQSPISLYGKTKLAAETSLLQRENVISARLGTVCGMSYRPRLDLLVNNLTSKLYFDKSIEIYEPHYRRGAVYIGDVVNAFVFFMENSLEGIYNVSDSNNNHTKLNWAKLICNELGIPHDKILINNDSDIDKRDYLIKTEKLKRAGFECNTNINTVINEVVNFCKLFNKYEEVKGFGNG